MWTLVETTKGKNLTLFDGGQKYTYRIRKNCLDALLGPVNCGVVNLKINCIIIHCFGARSIWARQTRESLDLFFTFKYLGHFFSLQTLLLERLTFSCLIKCNCQNFKENFQEFTYWGIMLYARLLLLPFAKYYTMRGIQGWK